MALECFQGYVIWLQKLFKDDIANAWQNNANEGPLFTPQNIRTEDDFVAFLRRTFPLFSESDISKVLFYYPSTNASTDLSAPDFATTGLSGATALNESTFGTGQQQRADVRKLPTHFSLKRADKRIESLCRDHIRVSLILGSGSIQR